ncbi:MAG: choline/carnitine O-acyltransferase [Planctomycetaceae bacterium]|nr:choline/carnitine O-acyltransferase [Planctomycetaceae bacterium]
MTVFASDAGLPRLPLPDLSETCTALKTLIQPLNTPEEFARASAAIDEFAVAGQPLQESLHAFNESLGGNQSWLRPFWDDSYLSWRGKLPMEMNYVLELHPKRWGATPLASFVVAMCRFLRRTGTADLPCELSRDKPLSMDSLRFMAYTRIPDAIRDTLYRLPLSGPLRIAVASRGLWFIVTLSDASGRMASATEVDRVLRLIPEMAGGIPAQPPIGAMTAGKRDDAAAVRACIQRDIGNRSALADIENCLFSVSLDCGEDCANFGHDLIAGDCANRWFDKSLQVIASPDGRLGINLEHSGCDAGFWAYALDWVDGILHNPPADPEEAGADVVVRPLTWRCDAETVRQLSSLEAEHRANAERMESVFVLLDCINRDKVKALGCGPDVFTQLAFQTAYYRLTGNHGSAYEAVAVRNFYGGRTECARPATAPAMEFARLLATDKPDAERLRQALKQAEQEHKSRLGACQKGLGVERHLFGLSVMARMRGGADTATSLFSDPALLASTRNTMSTSNVGGPSIRFFGFGPVVADGLGLGYAMVKDGLQLTVATLADTPVTARQFAAEVETVVRLMRDCLSRTATAG